MKRHNDQTTNDPKTTIAFSLPLSIVERLKAIAMQEVRPVSWVAQRLLVEAMEREAHRG